MADFSFISTEYSPAFIILCIAVGAAYAWLLYRNEKRLNHTSVTIRRTLFVARAVAVSLIAFLLLKPVLNTKGQYTEEPLIPIVLDESESVAANTNDTARQRQSISRLIRGLDENFRTKHYAFGEDLRFEITYKFTDKQTNISQALEKLQAKHLNQNVGALVLITDGIYNSGNKPEYTARQLNFPVYTLALGSTEAKTDLVLRDVEYNKIVFLNDSYPLRVSISAKKLKDRESRLKVYQNGQLIQTKNIQINTDDFFTTIELEAKAEQTGATRLRFELEEARGEYSTQNNVKEVIFEVIDSKQKILLLANAPHPDIAAIKSSLDDNKNFETDFALVGENTKPLTAYNLVIMHQLPSKTKSLTREIQSIKSKQIPVLWILGKQSAPKKFNAASDILRIHYQPNTFDPATGIFNENFTLFELNPEIQNLTENAPPLETHFGEQSGYDPKNILFTRKIQNVETSGPLIGFAGSQKAVKSAVITGEGLWRWKIYDYKMHQNHILFNELIQKTCQYLSLKADKDRFRVNIDNIFSENQDVVFRAERYNKSYELVNDAEVKLKMSDSEGAEYNFVFDRTAQSYEINVGKLPPGDYVWEAETTIDQKSTRKQGSISVQSVNIEAANTQADHHLLYNISDKTGGEMRRLSQSSEIVKLIKENQQIKAVAHTEQKSYSIIHNKLLFFLIAALLIAEWFIRKYAGTY